jgi:hypothetical protein
LNWVAFVALLGSSAVSPIFSGTCPEGWSFLLSAYATGCELISPLFSNLPCKPPEKLCKIFINKEKIIEWNAWKYSQKCPQPWKKKP